MLRPVHLIQIVIGFIGFGFVILSFWIGEVFSWSAEVEIFVALSAAVVTILVELVISVISLKESIVKLYPSLDFSVQEQKNIYNLIAELLDLKTQDENPFARLALTNYSKVQEIIKRAVSKSDYNVDNMFEANLVALEMLTANQEFLGLSSIINPDHWNYDTHLKKYKDLNYSQARKGVIIKRVFLLEDEQELEVMQDIMNEQKENGIRVHYVLSHQLKGLSFFPDFTLLPTQKFGLYVPSKDKLLTCIATINPEILSQIENDFEKILARSKEL